MTETASIPNLAVERKSSGILLAKLSGNWRGQRELPGLEVIRQALGEGPPVKSLEFDTAELVGWDSRFVAFIGKCGELCHDRSIEFKDEGLPEGVRRLLRLSHAVPGKLDTRGAAAKPSFLQDLGERAV